MPSKRNRMIEAREALGWTQRELAERAHITDSYCGMIEAGIRTPSLRVAARIAAALGKTMNDLFGKLDPEEKDACSVDTHGGRQELQAERQEGR